MLLAAVPAGARYDAPSFPPELLDPQQYPGMRGILELSGRNVHNCGNLLLHVTNFGLIGSEPGQNQPYSSAPSAQWPAGSGTEYLYAAGLWVGAILEGEAHVTTGSPPESEFFPGRTELDVIYATREQDPRGSRLPSPNADDDQDGRIDEDWLDGRDNDGDGRVDEDFAAISNQMLFAEYGDTDPNINRRFPEHKSLDLHVQQLSLCWEDPLVDDFIAFEFHIIHNGTAPLEDVYVGMFADADIGPRGRQNVFNDDRAGFWEGVRQARFGNEFKNVKVSVGYMWDDDGDEGESEGYIGLVFLGAQAPGGDTRRFVELHNFRFFSGDATFEQGGDPGNDEERYKILSGQAPRSLPPPDPDTGFRPPQTSKRPADYRMVVSAGPFTVIDVGDTLVLQTAIVIGKRFEGMLENAVQAQLTFDGVFLDCDGDPTTGVGGAETAVCGPENAGQRLRINRCNRDCDQAPPSDDLCWVTVPADGCVWINDDCEVEEFTGEITGVDGRECVVHWLISTAPPPPRMRAVARESQVDLLWDNLSEITPDLRLNVLDFESYRIWRADNWTRPFGTDVATGPGNALWILLAEFDLPDNGIGSDTGLESIRYRPQIPEEVVQFYQEWFEAHPLLEPPDVPGFTAAQLDTAKAMARGAQYYAYTDPPFKPGGTRGGPCPQRGPCEPLQTPEGVAHARCNADGVCQETFPPPHNGQHYFYAVTATDHKLRVSDGGILVPSAPGLSGSPNSNFVFVNPITRALEPDEFGSAKDAIYVVPNPATRRSLRPWQLQPNNDDPTGVKVEFHHLPRALGTVRVYTLAGDLVIQLPFDGRDGNGTLAWDLISRNGQEVTSGIYLYSVQADAPGFERFVGKFAVVR